MISKVIPIQKQFYFLHLILKHKTINFNNGVDDILIGSDVPVFYQQDDINDSSTKKNTKLNPRLLFLTNKK